METFFSTFLKNFIKKNTKQDLYYFRETIKGFRKLYSQSKQFRI